MTAAGGVATRSRSRRPSCAYIGCPVRPYRGHQYCSEHEALVGHSRPNPFSSPSSLPPVSDDGDEGLSADESALVSHIETLHRAVVAAQQERDQHPPELRRGELTGLHISMVEQEHFRRVSRLGDIIGQRVHTALSQHPEANTLLVRLHRHIKDGYNARVASVVAKNKSDARIIEARLADGRIDVPDYNRRMRMLRKRDERLMQEAKRLLIPESYPEAARLAQIRTHIVSNEIARFRPVSRSGLRTTTDTERDSSVVKQLRGVFPDDWIAAIPPVRVESTPESASYMEVKNGTPTITAGNTSFVTGVHESSHVMERYSASVRSASWAFIRDHGTQDNGSIIIDDGKGQSVVKRNPRSPFQKPYVGRLYHNDGVFEARSSEVFSTGMEHLYLSSDVTNPMSDPTPMGQNKDPAHTNLVLGLLATAEIDIPPTQHHNQREVRHGY